MSNKETMDKIVQERVERCEKKVSELKISLAQAEAELKGARRDALFWENVRES